MRVFGCLLLALTFLGANIAGGQTTGIHHPPNHAIIASDRIQVRASIDPASTKAGTPIVIKLISKNIWYDTVTVSDYGAEVDYELIVVDSSGREVPRTRLGDQLFRGEYVLLRTAIIYLEPGQEIRAEIDVTKIYQLTEPGTYYMWATRDPFPGSPDEPKLTGDLSKLPIERAFSNPVQFTIVP
jgi:hypothetical protein